MKTDAATFHIMVDTLPEFLHLASEHLARDRVVVHADEGVAVGQPCSIRVVLPGAGIVVSARGQVAVDRPDGCVVDIVAWDDGDERVLWSWVGLCWEILRQAGVSGFQTPAPERAIVPRENRLRSMLLASASDPAGRTTPGGAAASPTPASSAPGSGRTPGDPRSPGSRSSSGPSIRPAARQHRRLDRPKRPRRPISARIEAASSPFVVSGTRYAFKVSLGKRPLPFVLDDIRKKGRSGWLEISGTRVSRRLGFFDGALVQLEQRPHVSVDFLVNAVSAMGLDRHLVIRNRERLKYADAPEELLVSLGVLTQDQAERVLSRRLSVQLARAIDASHRGEAGFLDTAWPKGRPALLPDPSVPLVRMIWDGSRSIMFRRPRVVAENLRERLLAAALRWVGRADYPLEEATHRVEELDLILRCKEDISSVTSYLAGEGKEDRTALATLWSLLLLGFVEAQASVDGIIDGLDMTSVLGLVGPGEAPVQAPGSDRDGERAVSASQTGDQVAHGGSGGGVPAPGVDSRITALENGASDTGGGSTASGGGEVSTAGRPVQPRPPEADADGPVKSDSTAAVDSAALPPGHPSRDAVAGTSVHAGGENTASSPVEGEGDPPFDQGTLAALASARDRLEKLDHFEVLGISWSAHPDDIDPAYFRAVAQYRPAAESDDPRTADLGRAILHRIAQAHEVLASPATRRSYRELIVGDELATETARLMKEGGLHYLLDRQEEALRCFERAADLAPDREDVQSELARQRASMQRTRLEDHSDGH